MHKDVILDIDLAINEEQLTYRKLGHIPTNNLGLYIFKLNLDLFYQRIFVVFLSHFYYQYNRDGLHLYNRSLAGNKSLKEQKDQNDLSVFEK